MRAQFELTTASIERKRQLDVRPWNVKAGDVVAIRLDFGGVAYASVTRVESERGYFSGESRWKVYTDLSGADTRHNHYLTVYRTVGSKYGPPERVTVWRP
jgi:hypothetical protein